MVSSAIYFPIIILITLFAIHIMLDQYNTVKETSAIHMELRAQASIKTGTGILIENTAGNDRDLQAYKIAKNEEASFGKIYGDKYIQFNEKRSYLIDEQSEVRNPLW